LLFSISFRKLARYSEEASSFSASVRSALECARAFSNGVLELEDVIDGCFVIKEGRGRDVNGRLDRIEFEDEPDEDL